MSTLRHTPLPSLFAFALLACSSKASDPTTGSGSTGSGSGSGAAHPANTYPALGHKPANARRPTAPPNIDQSALAIGATVPAVELVDAASGKPWTLAGELSKHARVILVFYRGDW
jgi:hypothetical protein